MITTAFLIAAVIYLYVGAVVMFAGICKYKTGNARITFSGWLGILAVPVVWALMSLFVVLDGFRKKDA